MGAPEHGRSEPARRQPLVRSSVLAEALTDPAERARLDLPADEAEPFRVVVELNLRHREGLTAAEARFAEFYRGVVGTGRPPPVPIANTYYACLLSVDEARRLARVDGESAGPERAIYRVWPDFLVEPLIDRSVSTIKGDAAQRSYDAVGGGITWAVIDSGIDGAHQHFRRHANLDGDAADLHRDFTVDGEAPAASARTDGFGHGTHVAGIIAGAVPDPLPKGARVRVGVHVADDGGGGDEITERDVDDLHRLAGVAPRCRLVSLKTLDDTGRGYSSNIIRALRYVREEVNGSGKLLRIQGVNLSVGYEFDAKWFACGQSPLCVEVDRLVRSGVVVVVAAGNTGYGRLTATARQTSTGLALTINDPGNAQSAITVGATHRDMPHTYGVSYFSSKGPTGDGRRKPDLVAPGERITSCAAGSRLAEMYGPRRPRKGDIPYLDDSGTSMAAPHVSGAIAAFLSIRREFIGQPERVKEIFLSSATSLGRAESFQGHGVVDLMRAIQSV
ncbi:S8 family peptidase [soil metagenome]|jgi:subtilisin family serine protease|nr:S8 family peptidase [Euzebyaceae bacterium]